MLFFTNLTLKRGLITLLENANATINPGQKVGLVGKNGCGKSSLFALLKNEMSAEGGEVSFPSTWALAWVNQETPALDCRAIDYVIQGDREYSRLQQALQQANADNDGNAIASLHSQLDAIDAWTIEARAGELLHGLGFSQAELVQPVKAFSGGWRMRLNLAQALICRSDLLLLDEPTNHLDLDAVIWLERWLKQYPGTLILISHDRDFLDPIVGKILHIEQQKLNEYTGDYSSFELQRATKLAQQNAMYRQQQLKIDHLQRYIDRFKAKATKAKQAQSRIKALERMEKIAPAYVDNPFHFEFREPLSLPSPLLMMENASAGYGSGESAVEILSKIKLNLVPGSRIGLLGKNGAGKSTLFNVIAGTLPLTSGSIYILGENVTSYSPEKRAKYLSRVFQDPKMGTAPRMTVAENLLIAKFRGEKRRLVPRRLKRYRKEFQEIIEKIGNGLEKHLDTPIEFLSGGQRQALSLLMATLKRPELLLLDEHTAALDPKTSVALMSLTDEFVNRDQLTALMITHHMEDALKYGNRLIVMKDGQIIQDLHQEEKAKMTIADYYSLFE